MADEAEKGDSSVVDIVAALRRTTGGARPARQALARAADSAAQWAAPAAAAPVARPEVPEGEARWQDELDRLIAENHALNRKLGRALEAVEAERSRRHALEARLREVRELPSFAAEAAPMASPTPPPVPGHISVAALRPLLRELLALLEEARKEASASEGTDGMPDGQEAGAGAAAAEAEEDETPPIPGTAEAEAEEDETPPIPGFLTEAPPPHSVLQEQDERLRRIEGLLDKLRRKSRASNED